MTTRCALLLAAGILLGVTSPAGAFFEDLCIAKSGDGGGQNPGLTNCLEGCANPDDKNCTFLLIVESGVGGGAGRSMIHVDATYFLATALGIREDVAYWIAAYDQATDLAQYTPFDTQGNRLACDTLKTETIDGLERTNFGTGGVAYHYDLPFSPSGTGRDVHGSTLYNGQRVLQTSGYYPYFPTYPTAPIPDQYEGTLINLRSFAFTQAGIKHCAAGFTSQNAGTKSYFTGSDCYTSGGAAADISGRISLLGFRFVPEVTFTSGPLQYQKGVTAIDTILQNGTGILWLGQNKPKVHAAIATMGMYLHALQDRVSHVACSDAPSSFQRFGAVGTAPTPGSKITLNYDQKACDTQAHVTGHYYETGQGALPLRDYQALFYTLYELMYWGNAVKAAHPDWIVNPSFPSSTTDMQVAEIKKSLIGTLNTGDGGAPPYSTKESYSPVATGITGPLGKTKPGERLAAMNDNFAAYFKGLSRTVAAMPGNDPKLVCPK